MSEVSRKRRRFRRRQARYEALVRQLKQSATVVVVAGKETLRQLWRKSRSGDFSNLPRTP